MTDADGYWLAGLADGEACFYLSTRRRRVGRSDNCQCISFCFKIALRADDRAVLEHVQSLLDAGRITINERRTLERYVYNGRAPNGKPLVQFTICKKEDLLRVVALFRRYPLRSKKSRDFDLWAEALDKFVAFTKAAPRKWGARTSRIQIRPQQDTPLRRFKRIPVEIYAEIQRYERQIKDVRQYQKAA